MQPQPEDDITQTLKAMAKGWSQPGRSPVLRTPADEGLAFENVTFPSQDGVPLEAWYLPCPDSRRLVIVNHPLTFNRYGLASHLEPWRSFGAAGGNTFEVDYLADYRILHEAGYHVLTYDERNFGLSGSANGGLNSGGRFEARDVIGSLRYVRSRADLEGVTVGLFSRCNGANATLFAIHTEPREFDDVRCLVLCQPLSIGSVMRRELEMMNLVDHLDALEREVQLAASCTFDQMSPNDWARSVHTPTFIYQVHDDLMTTPADVQATFDALPIDDKSLHWIHGTQARWDGYLEFQRRPGPMLDWLNRYMT
ncbi:alpha/beta hydrolase family protein [Salinicola lusitanus]|uniref:alpha/beta hydrolase family protein n=1 Tax=Salinicola lusitanus TaxID=1949085 RepID=UPI000DA1AF4D|nr:alpha/beta hydrolase [Salinicola lusitanus]